MAAEVSDDVIDLFAAIGRHDEIAAQIDKQFGGLMDLVSDSASYDMPGTLPPDVIQDIQRLDTPFRGFANTIGRIWRQSQRAVIGATHLSQYVGLSIEVVKEVIFHRQSRLHQAHDLTELCRWPIKTLSRKSWGIFNAEIRSEEPLPISNRNLSPLPPEHQPGSPRSLGPKSTQLRPLSQSRPPQSIPGVEMSLISKTTAGKNDAAGYFSFLWLLEIGIRQGQVKSTATNITAQKRSWNSIRSWLKPQT